MVSAILIPTQRFSFDVNRSHSTTPSLQSILVQKKCSNCTRLSISSLFTQSNSSSTSIPSLTSNSSSLDSYESHPLESFNVMQDIDQDFFAFDRNNKYFELMKPVHSTPTLRDDESTIDNESFNLKSIIKKSNFVSNLTNSIKSFTNSTMQQNNNMLFGIQPRLTVASLPQTILKVHSQDTELETFKTTATDNYLSTDIASCASTMSIIRNREARINSQFLRLYSHESSSRAKGLLPEISYEEETQMLIEQQGKKPVITNEREFALLVRQRLWQCIVLPPREESSAINSTSEYVFMCDENAGNTNEINTSLIRNVSNVKPWTNLEDNMKGSMRTVLKPRGVIQKNVQFTVKGWCNSRWKVQTAYD